MINGDFNVVVEVLFTSLLVVLSVVITSPGATVVSSCACTSEDAKSKEINIFFMCYLYIVLIFRSILRMKHFVKNYF